jgi:hypothetical protein
MQDEIRMARSLLRSTDGSDGPAGVFSITITSRCGCTRNAMAHSTSVEECTSMSGSTMMVHFGRMLLAIAARITCRASPA